VTPAEDTIFLKIYFFFFVEHFILIISLPQVLAIINLIHFLDDFWRVYNTSKLTQIRINLIMPIADCIRDSGIAQWLENWVLASLVTQSTHCETELLL